jgi:hypothetical protein
MNSVQKVRNLLRPFYIQAVQDTKSRVQTVCFLLRRGRSPLNVSNSIQSHCGIKPSVKIESGHAMKQCGMKLPVRLWRLRRIADRHPTRDSASPVQWPGSIMPLSFMSSMKDAAARRYHRRAISSTQAIAFPKTGPPSACARLDTRPARMLACADRCRRCA